MYICFFSYVALLHSFLRQHTTQRINKTRKKKGGREEKLKVQKNITDQGKKCYLFIFSGRIPSLSSFLEV
jgi:hypothetical protein